MLKKMMIASLMAASALSAISPALAQDREREGRGRWNRADVQTRTVEPDSGRDMDRRGNGGRSSQERSQQSTSPAPVPPAPVAAPRGVAVGEPNPSAPRGQWQGRGGPDGNWRRDGSDAQKARGEVVARDWKQERGQSWNETRRDNAHDRRQDWRQDGRDRNGDWRNDHRDNRNWNHGDRDRYAWNQGWRNDRRYDWRGYRNSYGDRYRIGRYYAPRGWDYGYRRFSIGFSLSNILFSRNYWIDDPYSYRLPPAYGSLRWIRYYDDALLVDVRNGYVVDVIHDFFW